jgi:hypothetical protein
MVITRIQTLTAENKELREQIEGEDDGYKSRIEELKKEITYLEENSILEEDVNDWVYRNLDSQIVSNEEMEYHELLIAVGKGEKIDDMDAAFIADLKEENKNLKEDTEIYEKQIKNLKEQNEKLKEMNKDEIKSLEEQIKTLLEERYNGDSWAWAYGKKENIDDDDDNGKTVPNSVDFIMAGGGDHWWNYVIDKDEKVYIRSKDGLNEESGKMLYQSACGKYLSIQDEDYECFGDEVRVEFEYLIDPNDYP